MGVIISLLISIVFAAIIVWVADWAARPQTALDILNQRLARGEIDRAEYDQKLSLLTTC
jgi:uncharacterized membrane protein